MSIPPSKKRILVVDDEPETAKMFGTILEISGYEVYKVHGPAQAMAVIESQVVDLLVLDVMMPGVSGLELCKYLRRDPRFQTLPVVVVSAKAQPEDIREGMAAGASAYLTKPLSTKQLIRTVSELLLRPA
ncbi:MAG TPA: response regulator [Anaerolineales bacterium]|nr:response regulator [Anaerolineales bacterium]